VAQDDSAGTAKGAAVTVAVLANDSSPNGDPLTVTSLTQPANGMVVLNADGTVTYTPKTGFAGSDSFTYRASDGVSESEVATVTIQVFNHAPVARDDSAVTLKSTAVTIDILANDEDADGDALTVIWLSQPKNGTLVFNANGTITYTPKKGFTGTETFTYKLTDGLAESNIATVTITVT
jgi:hypothetical protein